MRFGFCVLATLFSLVMAHGAAALSLSQKIAQLFIINVEGNTDFVPVEDCVPGGYLLFSHNIADSPAKVMAFTKSIKTYHRQRGLVVPYLAIDQEGGLVNRLRGVAGPLPSPQRVVAKLTPKEAEHLYTLQALQMRLLGIDVNIAPVVEVLSKENADFLGDRSYGAFLDVQKYATICVDAFSSNGVACVIKHFPGNANGDPHVVLPTLAINDAAEVATLESPFAEVASHSPVAGILLSHVVVPKVDAKPACLSKIWASKARSVAKNALLFTDDVYMKALLQAGYSPLDASILALKAGLNCIMSSEKRIAPLVAQIAQKAQSDTELLDAIEKSASAVLLWKEKNCASNNRANNSANDAGDANRAAGDADNNTSDDIDNIDTQEKLRRFNKVMWDDIYLYREKFM